jgi:hypothetical protein
MKIRSVGGQSCFMRMDGQTDMTKAVVAFRRFAKARKSLRRRRVSTTVVTRMRHHVTTYVLCLPRNPRVFWFISFAFIYTIFDTFCPHSIIFAPAGDGIIGRNMLEEQRCNSTTCMYLGGCVWFIGGNKSSRYITNTDFF